MSDTLESSILSILSSSGLPKLDHTKFKSILYVFPNSGRSALTQGSAIIGGPGERKTKAVVLKTISKGYLVNLDEKKKEKLIQYFEREAGIWRYTGSHPNILKLFGYMEVPGQSLPSLVSPFYPLGNARWYVEYPSNSHLSARERIKMTRDIARGLEFCEYDKTPTFFTTLSDCPLLMEVHDLSPVIVHRDVRGVNVLIDKDDGGELSAVLIDFGSAKLSDPRLFPVFNSTQISNDAWSPPEYVLNPDEYTNPTKYGDIWSLACTCYEIFTARDPYHRSVDLEDAHSAGQLPVRPPRGVIDISDALWEFLEHCWNATPESRPSAREAALVLDKLSSI